MKQNKEIEDELSKILRRLESLPIQSISASVLISQAHKNIMELIATETRKARLDELERLYDKTPPENGMSDVIADRIQAKKEVKDEVK